MPANLIKSEKGTTPPPSPLIPVPHSSQSWGSALPPALSRVQDAPGVFALIF